MKKPKLKKPRPYKVSLRGGPYHNHLWLTTGIGSLVFSACGMTGYYSNMGVWHDVRKAD